jgi:hypothetical protein
MFWRKSKKPQKLTGARGTLRASHRDQATGDVHNHEWEITAWWPYNGTSGEVRRHQLEEQIKSLEGRCLPDQIAWAENLAEYIVHAINSEYACYGGYGTCCLAEIVRHDERLLARWPV